MIQTYGSHDRFAIECEWLACDPLADDGQRATWAEVTIFAAGRRLTRHIQGDAGVQEGFLGPASILAEWFLDKRNRLLFEERVRGASAAGNGHEVMDGLDDREWDAHEREMDSWWEAHCLQGARQGAILPSVMFWRRGSDVVVSWRNDPEPRSDRRIQYLPGSGQAVLPAGMVFGVWEDFSRAVATKAATAKENSGSRQALSDAIGRLNAPWFERMDALAARVGRSEDAMKKWLRPTERSPTDMASDFQRDYGIDPRTLLEERDDSPIAMAARSASPDFTEDDHCRLLQLREKLEQSPIAEGLMAFRKRLAATTPTSKMDFEVGYLRARETRLHMGRPTGKLEIEEWLRSNGATILDVKLDDRGTDGIVLWRKDGAVLVAANENSARAAESWGRRAMLAHEAYHVLYDSVLTHSFGECRSMATPSPSERRANAFSAELLLPEDAMPTYVWAGARKQVEALCAEYVIGWELCVRQLANHDRLSREDEEALLGAHQ